MTRSQAPTLQRPPRARKASRPVRTPQVTVGLVAKAKSGDRAALNELIERYHPRVRRLARRNMNRLRPLHDSLDVTQEVFVQALKAFQRFEMRDNRSFHNWLAKIVESTTNGLRDREAAKKRPRLEPLGFDPVSTTTDIADHAAVRERHRAAREAVAGLPPAHRAVVRLRYYEQLPWREVARKAGRASPDAARQAHRLALQRLRGELEQAIEA